MLSTADTSWHAMAQRARNEGYGGSQNSAPVAQIGTRWQALTWEGMERARGFEPPTSSLGWNTGVLSLAVGNGYGFSRTRFRRIFLHCRQARPNVCLYKHLQDASRRSRHGSIRAHRLAVLRSTR